MNLEEITKQSEYIYKGRIINLRKDLVLLPNGKQAQREVIEHPGGASVLAVTDDGQALFVEQYRIPFGKVLLEIPAGKLEKGEDPRTCAAREIIEETGYKAKELEPIVECFPSPGCYGETLYLFLAKGLIFVGENPDADEFLKVVKIPIEKAVNMAVNGEFEDAKTIISLLIYAKKYLNAAAAPRNINRK